MTKFVVAAVVAALALAVAGSALAVPATANADVLYEPQHNIIVGSCFSLTYWYQSYSGGSRYISAYVTKNGRRVSRTVTARAGSRWRSKIILCPGSPGRYRVVYRTGGIRWSDGFRVGMGD